jgi:hypothetical protein
MGTVLASIVIFVMILIMPMALASYAIHRDFMDAFALGEIVVRTGRVLNYYLTAYLITIVVSISGLALLWVPYMGFFGGILIFYSGTVFFNLVGFLYYRAG